MAVSALKLNTVNKNEITAAEHIPYTCHVDPYTVMTENGDYIQVIKLQGISYQTVDNDLLNNFHEKRNILYKNVASGQLSIWTSIVRRRDASYPKGDYQTLFGQNLADRYKAKATKDYLYQNDIYIAVIYRDVGDLKAITAAKKIKRKTGAKDSDQKTRKFIKAVNDVTNEIVGSLSDYESRKLGTYSDGKTVYSEIIEYFGLLVNGRYEKKPIYREDIRNTLSTVRISFGTEAAEIRMTKGCRYLGALGIKEYCAMTEAGMLDSLLTLKMEYILTQSFTFSNKQKSISNIKLQRDRLENSGDLSETQIDELDDALDDLTANRIVAGEHHLSFFAFADNIEELEDNLTVAKTELGNASLVIAREDTGLEAAFWAQLPGNLAYRPRPALITSRNFSGFSPFHNFPKGHIDGNHWGPAVCMLKTTSDTPYYFGFHRYEKGMPPGNGSVVGPTGTGKTVVMGFFFVMAEKYNMRRVFFDKDQGAAIMVNAAGGHYTVVRKGEATGFNPLQMEPTPSNIEFISKLLKRIVEMSGGKIGSKQEREIFDAIHGVMELPKEDRRLFNMLPFMDMTAEDSVAQRLARWAGDGDRAWVFDNEVDQLSLDNDTLGFDMTDVLDDDVLRTPIAMFLIHRIRDMINGTPFLINFDEGWKYARDPILGPEMEDFYRTIRKLNGIIVFGTNDASDVSRSEIGKVILQQSQWQIFFPNQKAKREYYIVAMDLTENEYQIIRTLEEKSRCFLIKRGVNSVVVKLDLGGMDEEITVLSGSAETVQIMNRAIKESGNNPDDWLPHFQEMKHGNKPMEKAGESE
jgi:type IV secretion system protein VirB4